MRVLVVNAGSSSLKHALIDGQTTVVAGEERWDPDAGPGRHASALRSAIADAKGEIFAGVGQRDYAVPALAAGTYQFLCTVHPNMTGTLTAQ